MIRDLEKSFNALVTIGRKWRPYWNDPGVYLDRSNLLNNCIK